MLTIIDTMVGIMVAYALWRTTMYCVYWCITHVPMVLLGVVCVVVGVCTISAIHDTALWEDHTPTPTHEEG